MGDLYGLKFHFSYVQIPRRFKKKSLHAQKRSILLLNLYFVQKSSFLSYHVIVILPKNSYLFQILHTPF